MAELYGIDWIVRRYVSKEPESFKWESPWSHGSIQWRERILTIAALCMDTYDGEVAEIGCHTGCTTRDLAYLAERRGKRAIAIDPWIEGTLNCEGWEYDTFLETTKDIADILTVIRDRSQSPQAVTTLAEEDLCFALVDGSHEYEDCFDDIMAVGHAGVICVDDILWNNAVRLAFREGAERLKREMITHPMCKEGYLV